MLLKTLQAELTVFDLQSVRECEYDPLLNREQDRARLSQGKLGFVKVEKQRCFIQDSERSCG